jgi:hypothetical protein
MNNDVIYVVDKATGKYKYNAMVDSGYEPADNELQVDVAPDFNIVDSIKWNPEQAEWEPE